MPFCQTAAFFHGQIAYDDHYAGTADSCRRGERLGDFDEQKPIVFTKNHGVLVVGDTVAQAYRDFTASSAGAATRCWSLRPGRPLHALGRNLATGADTWRRRSPLRAERERLFFEAMMRVLDRELPANRI